MATSLQNKVLNEIYPFEYLPVFFLRRNELGHFWSGYAGRSKKGLEIEGFRTARSKYFTPTAAVRRLYLKSK